MLVFGKKWFYSEKSGFIRAKWLYSINSGCIGAIVVVFEQSGCIRAKVVLFWSSSKIRILGQKSKNPKNQKNLIFLNFSISSFVINLKKINTYFF